MALDSITVPLVPVGVKTATNKLPDDSHQSQAVIADPATALMAAVKATPPALTDAGLVVRQAPIAGTLKDAAGTLSSTGNVSLAGVCIGARIFAVDVVSTFKLSAGGAVHTVRANAGADLNLINLVDPTVIWVSGVMDVSLFCLQ